MLSRKFAGVPAWGWRISALSYLFQNRGDPGFTRTTRRRQRDKPIDGKTRKAVDDGPERDGGPRYLFSRPIAPLLASIDSETPLEGFRACCDKTWKTLARHQIGAKHQPVQRRVFQRERDISNTYRARPSPFGCAIHEASHCAKTVLCDSGKKLVLIFEMPVGRHMRDARLARSCPQTERLEAIALEQLARCLDEPRF